MGQISKQFPSSAIPQHSKFFKDHIINPDSSSASLNYPKKKKFQRKFMEDLFIIMFKGLTTQFGNQLQFLSNYKS